MNSKDKLKPGEICQIKLKGLIFSSEGYATVGTGDSKSVRVFENISLTGYPSHNDFKGESTAIKEGDIAIVVKFIGRPHKIKTDPKWFKFDIYEVLIKGVRRQMFRQNLKKI
tara:strand:+ start:1414 stop:1749 length:336 start_codon:yes stop_codon:yes gene_type:complete